MNWAQLQTAVRNLGLVGFEDQDSEVVFKDGTPVTQVSTNLLGQVILS